MINWSVFSILNCCSLLCFCSTNNVIQDNTDTRRQSGLTHHKPSSTPMLFRLLHSSSSSSSSAHRDCKCLKTLHLFSCIVLDCFFTLLLLLLLCFANSCQASCNQIDRDSLLSFEVGLSTPSPLNWSSSVDCCLWEGIGCDGKNSRVTRLWLPFKGLKGTIFPSVLNLTGLSQINLSHNWLSGPLPNSFFKSLHSLQVLDLSYNRLFGQLTLSDGLPITIQNLDLSSNCFNGTIHPSFLQPGSNLISFNISNNSLTGQIPSSICNDSLFTRFLDFSDNHFVGRIPHVFGGCSNLEILRAGFNSLSGSIPDDIYNIESLQELVLPVNELSGTIADAIVKLRNLRILSLYGNQLGGVIPQNIGMLSNLEILLLHINSLNGTLPPSLMNCTGLTKLNLRANSFVGELSNLDFSRLVQLNTVDLGNNYFKGKLPVSLFSCKSLTAIRLATNKLEGEIFPNIHALQSLSFLSLSNNSLTNISEAIRILSGCKNLSTVILSKNFYNEAIPDGHNVLDSEGFQNLQVFGLGGCQLTGQIPIWLAELKKLQVIDLSFNRMTGTIPGWLGTLPNVFYLDLSQNLLSGNFPIKLIGLRRLASQEGAVQVDRSYLELPVFVQPNNASNQQYNQLSSLPPAIYLRNNSISGNIPVEIGLLKFIHVLDLSTNQLSGSIPDTISNLTNLEKLILSGNQLTGEIPASLRSLHFLTTFREAKNNLQGPIPIGGQFDTFSNSSYLGNPGLCGPILGLHCQGQTTLVHPSAARKRVKKKVIIGLILGLSFGIGTTLAVLTLWILSKRRILPRGDPDNKTDLETVSFNSSPTVGKETSLVVLFPSNSNEIKDLTISDILKATENFNQANIIGCGGFGLVYKATLANGITLAVKKLSGDMCLMEREFRAEVEALSTAQHKNLVSLRGYCVHNSFRLLIYSYMENGSLDYWLHEKTDGASQLDWPTRLKILKGASFGLAYMHRICDPHIVHRDIKSSNILLDDSFEAHVADFGLSRLILPYHTHVTTEVVGTLGYIPPEYSQTWIATLRGDIYSFGVVMLELLTGKRPVEIFKPKMCGELVAWVQQMRGEGKQNEVFDQFLRGKGFEEQMLQVLDVGCICVNQNPFKRPTIMEVVDWLKNIGSNSQTAK